MWCNVFDGVPVTLWSIFAIPVEVGLVVVVEVPGVVADHVWDNLGISLNSPSIKSFLDGHELKLTLFLLRLSVSTGQWHAIWRGSIPSFLGGVEILLVVPGMVALVVREDLR